MATVVGNATLVTGAAGFIGYHVSAALRRAHVEVVGLDNFNAYYGEGLKEARAERLRALGVRVVRGDVCRRARLEQLLPGVSRVVHLAAQAGVRYSLDHPLEYVKANVKCFVTLLEAVRRHDPAMPVVYASSSSVYGLNTRTPFSEGDRIETQASLYGATKESNERIAHVYHHLHGLRVTGLRFFTVYGPYGRPDMAYYAFARAIVDGRPIVEYRRDDGAELLRDFTYVDDVVDGIVAAWRRGSALRVYNLGNRHPERVSTLVRLLERGLGRNATRVTARLTAGDVPVTFANVSLAARELGYAPKTRLAEGIPRFVAWFRAYYRLEPRGDRALPPLPP